MLFTLEGKLHTCTVFCYEFFYRLFYLANRIRPLHRLYSLFVRDYRMCNLAKISVMPLFQLLLFEYNSTASSTVAENNREKVTILLVAVCSTFSNVKLVLSSFFKETR